MTNGEEHGADTGHELADQQPGFPHPGPPIVLVLTTDLDGRSSLRYRGDPEWAAAVLRAVAQGIEDGDII